MQTQLIRECFNFAILPAMALYVLRNGTIETEAHGEVVGATRAYIHLIGENITDVVRKRAALGIRRVPYTAHQEAGLPPVPRQPRNFKLYSPKLL